MKTEISLAPAADMVIENVLRPAMVNELSRPVQAARRIDAAPASERLNILARRQQRWDRRAARA
ncbi:MAG: hypothetical protein ACK4MQ_09480 [Hyphomonas sp.]